MTIRFIEEFWQAGDGDNWSPAIQRAMDNHRTGTQADSDGFLLKFGARQYNCSTTIEVNRVMEFVGEGGARQTYGTILKFPSGVSGFDVHHYQSTAPNSGRGDHCVFRNLCIRGFSDSLGGLCHGMIVRGRVAMYDVGIWNFRGHGMYMTAEEGQDNADNSFFSMCRFISNGKSGAYLDGSTANQAVFLKCDFESNLEEGCTDLSFLGNHYIACHAASNGNTQGGLSSGTTEGIPYRNQNGNSRSTYIGCYSESGCGDSYIDFPGMVLGGFMDPFGGTCALANMDDGEMTFHRSLKAKNDRPQTSDIKIQLAKFIPTSVTVTSNVATAVFGSDSISPQFKVGAKVRTTGLGTNVDIATPATVATVVAGSGITTITFPLTAGDGALSITNTIDTKSYVEEVLPAGCKLSITVTSTHPTRGGPETYAYTVVGAYEDRLTIRNAWQALMFAGGLNSPNTTSNQACVQFSRDPYYDNQIRMMVNTKYTANTYLYSFTYTTQSYATTNVEVVSNVATATIGTHDIKVGDRIHTTGLTVNVSSATPVFVTAIGATTISYPLTTGDVSPMADSIGTVFMDTYTVTDVMPFGIRVHGALGSPTGRKQVAMELKEYTHNSAKDFSLHYDAMTSAPRTWSWLWNGVTTQSGLSHFAEGSSTVVAPETGTPSPGEAWCRRGLLLGEATHLGRIIAQRRGTAVANYRYGWELTQNENGSSAKHWLGWGAAAPTVGGPYAVGDIILNTAAGENAPIGWMCTVAGSFGTWRELPRLNATLDSVGRGITETIVHIFAAGAGGSADEITVYNANCPGAMRITNVRLFVGTAVGGSTVRLHNATGGGGGTELSDAFDTASTGWKNSATLSTKTVSNNGTLIIRRSDSGVAGEIVITVVRT